MLDPHELLLLSCYRLQLYNGRLSMLLEIDPLMFERAANRLCPCVTERPCMIRLQETYFVMPRNGPHEPEFSLVNGCLDTFSIRQLVTCGLRARRHSEGRRSICLRGRCSPIPTPVVGVPRASWPWSITGAGAVTAPQGRPLTPSQFFMSPAATATNEMPLQLPRPCLRVQRFDSGISSLLYHLATGLYGSDDAVGLVYNIPCLHAQVKLEECSR